MKITKEMLAGYRAAIPPGPRRLYTALAIDSRDIEALLDERKALREALAHTLPVGPDGEAVVDAALALGEDE